MGLWIEFLLAGRASTGVLGLDYEIVQCGRVIGVMQMAVKHVVIIQLTELLVANRLRLTERNVQRVFGQPAG